MAVVVKLNILWRILRLLLILLRHFSGIAFILHHLSTTTGAEFKGVDEGLGDDNAQCCD